jgi:hypothetical protein
MREHGWLDIIRKEKLSTSAIVERENNFRQSQRGNFGIDNKSSFFFLKNKKNIRW